jgi:hypothetical protein
MMKQSADFMRRIAVTGALLFAHGGIAKPEAFPEVELESESEPAFHAFALDAWGNRTAYVLFDGNGKEGYSQIFVWVPEETGYDPPKRLTPNTEGDFPQFGLGKAQIHEEERSTVVWRVRQRYWKRGPSKRTVTQHDYVTGKTTTRTVSSKGGEGYDLSYAAGFGYGPKGAMATVSRGLPLEVAFGNRLEPQPWEKIKAPGGRPWSSLSLEIRTKNTGPVDRDSGTLSFSTDGFYHCKVASFPPDVQYGFTIRPYLEPPAYSNSIPIGDFLEQGLSVELPYGWYTYAVTGSDYLSAVKFRARNPSSGIFPFIKPLP